MSAYAVTSLCVQCDARIARRRGGLCRPCEWSAGRRRWREIRDKVGPLLLVALGAGAIGWLLPLLGVR